MTIQIADALTTAIDAGVLKMNLRGVALGDSWISGIDYVDTWAPFLRSASLMTEHDKATLVDADVASADAAVAAGDWAGATNAWGAVENDISAATPPGVNFYNILNWSCEPLCSSPAPLSAEHAALAPAGINRSILAQLYARHVGVYQTDVITALMNGVIKTQLGLPANVLWGSQSGAVFSTLSGDFMRPVTDVMDKVLAAGKVNVTVYEGQVDLICGTVGAERWMARLTWPGMPAFYATKKSVFYAPGDSVDPAGFSIVSPGLSLYYILKAGHMVPRDQGPAALVMLNTILAAQA